MDRLVALAANRRFLMVGLLLTVMIGGVFAFNQLNIEAYCGYRFAIRWGDATDDGPDQQVVG
jgi:hypothetical protein